MAGGSLWISGTPDGAKIYLNTQYQGETPLHIEGINSGYHTLSLKKEGYRDWQQRILIQQGQESQLIAELKQQQTAARPGMVLIPAGEFQMGSNQKSDEEPIHSVYLDAYMIDQYEVTLAEYRQCVKAGQCERPKIGSYFNWGQSERDHHPVNGVDWYNAKKYCEFANKRLPTEAEWEKAATWKDGRKYKYPSGKNTVSCRNAIMDGGGGGCGKYRSWPVGSKTQEINGTYDMAGNVWEWVADWYHYNYYQFSPRNNPRGPSSGSGRVLRGGGWGGGASLLCGATRGYRDPKLRGSRLGFRCALSP